MPMGLYMGLRIDSNQGGGGSSWVTLRKYGSNPGLPLPTPSTILVPTPNAGNPLIAIGSTSYPTNGELRDGKAVTDGTTDTWIMTAPVTFNNVANPFPVLVRYTSPAGANTWTPHGTVIGLGAAGRWNAGGSFAPSKPILSGGLWHIYVCGVLNTNFYWGFEGSTCALGHYTSPDLITWTEDVNNPVLVPDQPWEGSNGVYAASVIPYASGGWLMQYSTFNNLTGAWANALAVSTNLSSWTKQGLGSLSSGVTQAQRNASPPQGYVKEQPEYLQYAGLVWNVTDNIPNNAVFVSADGVNEMFFKTILSTSSIGWTAGSQGSCGMILNVDNSLNIVYNAANSSNRNQDGVASVPAFLNFGPTWIADAPSFLPGQTWSIGCDSTGTQYACLPGKYLAFTTSFTLSACMKRNDGTKLTTLFSKRSSADASLLEYALYWNASGASPANKLRSDISIAGSNQDVTGTAAHAQTASWHLAHLRVNVAGGNRTVGVRFDGSPDGSSTFAGAPTTFVNDVLIGVDELVDSAGTYANAQFCELNVWNRYLSAAEIAAQFTGTPPATTNQISRIKCNDGSGKILTDAIAFTPFTPPTALPAAPTQPVSLWQAVFTPNGIVSGGTLTNIFDTGPAKNDLTCSGSVLLEGNVANGWPAVREDGSTGTCTMTTGLSAPPLSYIAVLKPSAAGVAAGNMAILSGTVGGIEWQITQTSAKQALNKAFVSNLGVSNTSLSTSVPQMVGLTIDGSGNGNFYLNGVGDGTFSIGANTFTFTQGYVGAQNTGGTTIAERFAGDWYVIGVDSVPLVYTPAQMAAWNTRWAAQFGIS